MSPDGRVVYVALNDDDPQAESDEDAIAAVEVATRRVLARATQRVIATIAAGGGPWGVAVTP